MFGDHVEYHIGLFDVKHGKILFYISVRFHGIKQ